MIYYIVLYMYMYLLLYNLVCYLAYWILGCNIYK